MPNSSGNSAMNCKCDDSAIIEALVCGDSNSLGYEEMVIDGCADILRRPVELYISNATGVGRLFVKSLYPIRSPWGSGISISSGANNASPSINAMMDSIIFSLSAFICFALILA